MLEFGHEELFFREKRVQNFRESQIIATFVPASSAQHLLSLGEVAEGGALHYGIAFANALFLVLLNLRNSITQNQELCRSRCCG